MPHAASATISRLLGIRAACFRDRNARPANSGISVPCRRRHRRDLGTMNRLVVVKLLVRYRDQGLMPAAVMPVQHPMRQPFARQRSRMLSASLCPERDSSSSSLSSSLPVNFAKERGGVSAVRRQQRPSGRHLATAPSASTGSICDASSITRRSNEIKRRVEKLRYRERADEKDRLDPLDRRGGRAPTAA